MPPWMPRRLRSSPSPRVFSRAWASCSVTSVKTATVSEAQHFPDALPGIARGAVAFVAGAHARTVVRHDLVGRHGAVERLHGDALGFAAIAQLVDARAFVFDADALDAFLGAGRARVVGDQRGRRRGLAGPCLGPGAGGGGQAETGEQECAHPAIVGGRAARAAEGTMPR